jgi:hypothetical protein
MSELKPCPWCSAPAVLSVGLNSQWHTIYCSGPDECVSMGGANEGDLVSYWNTRAPDWQDISTAPRDDISILIGIGDEIAIGWLCPDNHPRLPPGYVWVGEDPWFRNNPTHWMPLPAPPKEVG